MVLRRKQAVELAILRQRKRGDVMKRTAAALLVLCALTVGVSAQNALSGLRFSEPGPVSLRFQNAELGQVLRSLSTMSGITILIDSRIDTRRSVDFTFKDAAIGDVLDAVINAANVKVTLLSTSAIALEPR